MAEAVDVFERKIQLLERKDQFGSLEGRRRALDRLLPSIRAAADPVTRDLYVARAAEKTGVGKNVIAGEAEAGQGRYGGKAAGREETTVTGERGGAQAHRPAALPPDIPAERELVQLMLWDGAYVERVRRELGLEAFRHPLFGALAADLLAGEREPSDEALRADWERLGAPPSIEPDREAMYNGAVLWLKDRPRRERIEELDRLMVVAPGPEKERLLRERQRLDAERPPDLPRPRRKAWKKELEAN
jgi:DNA primase